MSGESAVWTARIVPGESLPKTGSCRTACNACKSCFAHASVIFVALGAAGSEGFVLLAREGVATLDVDEGKSLGFDSRHGGLHDAGGVRPGKVGAA